MLNFLPDAKGHKRNKSDEGVHMVTVRMPPNEGPMTPTSRDVRQAVCGPPLTKVINVNAHVVGKVMSRDDLFYTPHRNNPFAIHYKDGSKIVARDSWASMMDLPSPTSPSTPPCTPVNPATGHRPARARVRRSKSLPVSPTLLRKELELEQHDSCPPRARRTFSVLQSIRKLEDDSVDDSYETRSDGSSSNDSAVDVRVRACDLMTRTPRGPARSRSHRDPALLLNTSWDGRGTRTENLARCMEARLAGHDWLPLPSRRLTYHHHHHCPGHPDDPQVDGVPRSYSSSESFMSLDESSVLSPTGSLSSYSETDSEAWLSRSHIEFYESRLRSRERFQELVRRWEAKQAAGGEGPPIEPPTEPRPLHGIRERSEPTDLQMEQRFKELRQRWEAKKDEVPAVKSPAKS